MKKWSVLPVAAALLFATSALASEGKKAEKESPKSTICAAIGQLLEDNNFVLDEQDELNAWVSFTINAEGEIVVLTVRTDNEVVERFIKAKLNYQSAGNSGLLPGGTYEVPIRFTS